MALQCFIRHKTLCVLGIQMAAIAYGNSALDNHDCRGIDTEHKVDDILNVMGIEEILLRIVIGGRCYDHKIGILISRCSIEGGCELQFLLGKIFFYVLVLDGGNARVDLIHLLLNDINHCNGMVLAQQCGNTKTHISCSCYCYFHLLTDFLFKLKHVTTIRSTPNAHVLPPLSHEADTGHTGS